MDSAFSSAQDSVKGLKRGLLGQEKTWQDEVGEMWPRVRDDGTVSEAASDHVYSTPESAQVLFLPSYSPFMAAPLSFLFQSMGAL